MNDTPTPRTDELTKNMDQHEAEDFVTLLSHANQLESELTAAKELSEVTKQVSETLNTLYKITSQA